MVETTGEPVIDEYEGVIDVWGWKSIYHLVGVKTVNTAKEKLKCLGLLYYVDKTPVLNVSVYRYKIASLMSGHEPEIAAKPKVKKSLPKYARASGDLIGWKAILNFVAEENDIELSNMDIKYKKKALKVMRGVATVAGYPVLNIRNYRAAIAKERETIKDTEREVDVHFCEYLKCRGIKYRRQIQCDAGVIDILTKDCIYELKGSGDNSSVFSAIGQLFCYRMSLKRENIGLALVTKKKIRQRKVDYLERLGIEHIATEHLNNGG